MVVLLGIDHTIALYRTGQRSFVAGGSRCPVEALDVEALLGNFDKVLLSIILVRLRVPIALSATSRSFRYHCSFHYPTVPHGVHSFNINMQM